MGREIKYKAWLPTIKKMTYGHTLEQWLLNFPHLEDFSEDTVWLQYTGLKDKNWKEIYEGDILTSTEYPFQDDGKYNYHGVIEWIEEEASFYMTKRLANSEKRGMSNGISQPIESIEEFEVIGNIYENPELIEV